MHVCECIMDLCAHLLMGARGNWVFLLYHAESDTELELG